MRDLLAVQMAEGCVLGKDEYGGYYHESNNWHRATNAFSDRGESNYLGLVTLMNYSAMAKVHPTPQ